MTYYQKHWFICINERSSGKASCGNAGNKELCDYLKRKVKDLGLSSPGFWRISSTGCMGRCEEGPLLVVYPEGRWYRCPNKAAIDAIVDHELNGAPLSAEFYLQDLKPDKT